MKSLVKFSKRRSSKSGNSKDVDNFHNVDSMAAAAAHKPASQATTKKEPLSVAALVLGSGSFSHDNGILRMALKTLTSATTSSGSSSSLGSGSSKAAQQFLRHSSSFLRVADLNMTTPSVHPFDDTCSIDSGDTSSMKSSCTSSGGSSIANFSYAASNPPPGVDHDPREQWIALDNGAGSHAPIAPLAVQALAKTGLEVALNQSMWTQHTASRYFKAAAWHVHTWPSRCVPNDALPPAGAKHEDDVLLWTGKFHHGLYGSELPAVRAVGIIPAAPQLLFDLLIDSNRVKEYNAMSLGREDLLVLQDNLQEAGPFGKSVTKVMRSKSSPPLLSKTMELVSMLHAQELDDGTGYLIVTRAVTHPDSHSSHDTSVLRSEILLGVNVIRRIDGDPDRCIMINMIHMRSPMVPMMIANRIGASAAANFIKDLRGAFC